MTTKLEVAVECGAEPEGPEDLPANIESHLRRYGALEPPPGSVFNEFLG